MTISTRSKIIRINLRLSFLSPPEVHIKRSAPTVRVVGETDILDNILEGPGIEPSLQGPSEDSRPLRNWTGIVSFPPLAGNNQDQPSPGPG